MYKQHWWKCNGPCQKRPPFHGVVKRSMNRPPGPSDRWYNDHRSNCGGTYTKIKEPEGFGQKKAKTAGKEKAPVKGQKDIRSFVNGSSSSQPSKSGGNFSQGGPGTMSSQGGSGIQGSSSQGASGGGAKGNIFGFGGTSFTSPASSGGGLKTKGKS